MGEDVEEPNHGVPQSAVSQRLLVPCTGTLESEPEQERERHIDTQTLISLMTLRQLSSPELSQLLIALVHDIAGAQSYSDQGPDRALGKSYTNDLGTAPTHQNELLYLLSPLTYTLRQLDLRPLSPPPTQVKVKVKVALMSILYMSDIQGIDRTFPTLSQ